MEELFQYCEPRSFSSAKTELDSRTTGRQLLEFAFCIKAGLENGKTDFKTDSIHNIGKGGQILKHMSSTL